MKNFNLFLFLMVINIIAITLIFTNGYPILGTIYLIGTSIFVGKATKQKKLK